MAARPGHFLPQGALALQGHPLQRELARQSMRLLILALVSATCASALLTGSTALTMSRLRHGLIVGGPGVTRSSSIVMAIKQQADSVPLPLAKGLEQALDDLIGKLYSILKAQEQISGRKFPPIESRFVQIIRRYDVKKTGALKLEEFAELVSDGLVWRSLLLPQSAASGTLPSVPTGQDIEKTFRTFDVDNSGSLDTRELTQALVALGLQVQQLEEDGRPTEGMVTIKGSDSACWAPQAGGPARDGSMPVSLKPWGAPLEALFQDDFGAVKTMALFNAIKLADSAYGQFREIVAGTWTGMPPNIKGFIPRLLKITAALRLLEQHYTTCAAWNEDGDSPFLKEAYAGAKEEVGVLKFRLSQLMFLLVQREGKVPLSGKEAIHLESVLTPLGVELTAGLDYASLASKLDEDGLSQRMWQGSLLDELDEGAKDFAAYFRLRKSSKSDLTAFEQSCYGQAVEKQLKAVLKNDKPGKEDLVLAELQALQALPC